MDVICHEIGINPQHLCETSVPGRFQLICDKQWLKVLEQHHKIDTFPTRINLDRRAHPSGPLEHPWTRILVQAYPKKANCKVFPPPRQIVGDYNQLESRSLIDTDAFPLTYSQAILYVTNTNFRNLWENAFKQYNAAHVKACKQNNTNQLHSPLSWTLVQYDVVLKEIINRVFHCPVIHYKLDRYEEGCRDDEKQKKDRSLNRHPNILPALIAIETSAHFSVLFYPPAILTNLHDCINYSPSILNKSYNKTLFIIYQILQLLKSFQKTGLFVGDIRLYDVLMRDNLWIQVIPRLDANLLKQKIEENGEIEMPSNEDILGGETETYISVDINDEDDTECSGNSKFDLKFVYDIDQFSLREYCEMWCNGQLSNYDYLTILNNASGRSLTNPAYHHIMPWVTDFNGRNGTNWRDLTKSKYRLNKGDIHLDLMFSQASQQNSLLSNIAIQIDGNGQSQLQEVAHHVSDFLSEITYFVYMARRTPQHILCEHVRPIWVPAEYPISIQRLQVWTPDECIPEFYSDPMIFKSIHEDLPDLELPAWASCPEDFICKHREALESQYVSERLQHWIDLNFGYKLSGKAAIKSKNVCLSMVDQHKNLCQRGVVQLFTQPHPSKRFSTHWFNRIPPRLNQLNESTNRSLKSVNKSVLSMTTTLNKSTENLQLPEGGEVISPAIISSSNSGNKEISSNSNFYHSTNFIELPKDYNPVSMLHSLESMQNFFSRTFPRQKPLKNIQEKMISSDFMFDGNTEDHSYTNHLFADVIPDIGTTTTKKLKNVLAPCLLSVRKRTLKNVLTEKRERELQVIGCFIVELFAMHRLRPLIMNGSNTSFDERLHASRTISDLYKHEIPKCLRNIVNSLLLSTTTIQKPVTDVGLPPPSASQILEPIFSNELIPFPINYYPTYVLIRSLHAFDFDSSLLELYTHFNCNGKECSKYIEIDHQRVLFERKIAECKVMSCCAHLNHLLEPIAYEQFNSVELLLPHFIDLLTNEQTCILSAWNLFDPISQALGISNTQKYLLKPVMKLYDVESFEREITSTNVRSLDANGMGQLRFSKSSSFKSRKSVKLYHHSFLLRLVVRFGLKCFLQNFITPLIEAVGGYKEPEDGNGFHYHSPGHGGTRKISDSLIGDNREKSTDLLERKLSKATFTVGVPESSTKADMEEVFSFDDDGTSDHISNFSTGENKSLDSFDMREAIAEEAKEETTPEKLAISEIIYGTKMSNASFEDTDKISEHSKTLNESPPAHFGPKSPTIEIPVNSFNRKYQLNAIDCEIGSRKSVDSFEVIAQAVQEEHKQDELLQDVGDKKNIKEENDSLQASVISKMSEAKAAQNNRISEMSAESLVWLAHRLGPVLTSRYITRNLLRLLSLCYIGQENLLPEVSIDSESDNLNFFTIADARVVGDRSASRVLECLMSITALFGEKIILLQYFPHISELIALAGKRVSGSLEGAVISTLQLLKYIVPCLIDATIMEHLKDTILESIILPIIRLLSSTQVVMPSGYLGRSVLSRKLLDAIYALSIRIGPDMSKEHLCVPALREFFLIFDKAYGITSHGTDISQSFHCESEELSDVFGPALAHMSYLAFLRFLGDNIMRRTLKNFELILTLCHEFEQPNFKGREQRSSLSDNDVVDFSTSSCLLNEQSSVNSFGTPVVGNRIAVASATGSPRIKQEIGPMEVLDMVAYKFDQVPTMRHLKGNWLAYWRHEVSRSEKDSALNLKQIKLQSFIGHTNSVRSIIALDNENSFISASKDKTVKLWSLRSEGDGTKISSCQYTYSSHKKSIHSLAFLEAMRFVVSCDSGIHIWDPFIGRPLGILDSPKHSAITVVKSMPSPSPLIIAGTTESTVKILDSRCMQYVNEWRVTSSSHGNATVRCLAVAPSGNWLAIGLSSGSIITLDARSGILTNSWRPMECDLLQLTAPNDHQLISSALDHSLAVWHANDGILHYQLKPPTEPAHFLQTIDQELIFATTGNRIGVHSDIGNSHAPYSVTKLRSEIFKGVLTSLAVLPLNKSVLAGNESGNIVLLC